MISEIPKTAAMNSVVTPMATQQRQIDASSSQARPFLLQAQDSKLSLEQRWKAVLLMGSLGQATRKDFEPLLSTKEWFLRNAALVAMQRRSAEDGEFAALRLLSDSALIVRSAAVQALSESKSMEARKHLWAELSHGRNFRNQKSLWIRKQIAEVLAKAPVPEERALFLEASKTSDPDVKLISQQALNSMQLQNSYPSQQKQVPPGVL